VAFGLVLGLLASTIAGRLFWLYMARRRWLAAHRAAPIEQASLEAERDRLKAENAMLRVRLERREKELQERLAERMAEAARYRNRLDAAHTEINKLRQSGSALVQTVKTKASTPAEDAAAARLHRRIDTLTELARKIERQRKTLRRRTDDDADLAEVEREAAAIGQELQSRLESLKTKA
jgi:hypothetical protein